MAKRKTGKTMVRSIIEANAHEMKMNPPKILAKTAAKSGAAQAEKQRVAILLNKSRKAGAKIPRIRRKRSK